MSNADIYVRARIDTDTKNRAEAALEVMGLSISDAIRLTLTHIADEQRLPFEMKAPNVRTKAALAELEEGAGKRFPNVDTLMDDLDAND